MASAANQCRKPVPIRPSLLLLQVPEQSDLQNHTIKFNAAYLDRRMQEHRLWQESATRCLCEEVLDEIGIAIPYRVRVTKQIPFTSVQS
jgi:hypothetical protein